MIKLIMINGNTSVENESTVSLKGGVTFTRKGGITFARTSGFNLPRSSGSYIRGISNNNIRVFPNPAHDAIMIKYVSDSYGFKITDITGKELEFVLLPSNQLAFTHGIDKYKPGLYFVTVCNYYSTNETFKMVIQ